MTVIAVDSSVLAAFILQEPGWERMADVLKDSATLDVAVKEVVNAIVVALRRGRITEDGACLKLKALQAL